jgi:hypothetical protein
MSDSDIEHDKKDFQQKRLHEDLAHYRNVMYFLGLNIPIESMCLPARIEKILLDNGFLTIYELTVSDFRKVKGLGKRSVDLIASRLNELVSIGI